jgi:hypothetical protein
MAAGDVQRDLPAFQLEVARLFFALPASRGFLLAGERPCSHNTSRHDLLKTSTSSPHPSADTFPPRAMPRRMEPVSAAGPRSGSTTATLSAGWLSGAWTPVP